MTRILLLCCCAALTSACIQRAPREKPETYLEVLQTARERGSEPLAQAAIKLGDMREKRAVELLLPLLSHTDARVRLQSAMALGQIGDPRAATPLLKALNAEQFRPARSIMAWALGETGSMDSREALSAMVVTEKSKAVYGGQGSVNTRYLKVLEEAVAKIDKRLSKPRA